MKQSETNRGAGILGRIYAGCTRIEFLSVAALLLICPAGALFAQVNPGQFINPSSSATVSKNQLLAPGKALREIERARKDILGGHFESAQQEIARALDIAPHFAAAKVLQGVVDLQTENYQEAKTFFQQAIDDDPAMGGAYVGMAAVLIQEQRFKASLPLLDHAEGLLPSSWFVHFAKGWAQLQLGDLEGAIKQADLAERFAGTDAERRSGLLYLRAMASIHLNDVATARERLIESVERDRGGRYAVLASKELESLQPLSAAR